MYKSFYVQSYHVAGLRWAQGCGDCEWHEWAEEVGKIKQAWRWSVNGMLTQLDREDPEIWYALGDAYHGGHGVERDVAHAEIWLRKAAETGHLRAMTKLGMLLSHSERTDEEIRESVEWYLRAAQLGDSHGMVSLGFAYREGRGVPVDERKAADWFIKAHAAGSNNAPELAGRLLSYHAENHLEAVKWLNIAVENGYDIAYYSLASIHENPQSPAYNPEEAFRCWLHVAERPQGDLRITAMFMLFYCCRDGNGTTQSRDEAKCWLNRILAIAPKKKSVFRQASKLRREMDEQVL